MASQRYVNATHLPVTRCLVSSMGWKEYSIGQLCAPEITGHLVAYVNKVDCSFIIHM